ncbi:MAG: class II fructose-bisphosphate aldolase [Candidatus Moranbacteria bacterium]|nr:class II fructose-bisphosphate aldolase [Candidatus Moranbacteria bacterium]MDZ4385437.1 class II fructose-bisphosphate aldolase [Candidatus Moranbacteria bacterium]
MIVDIREILAKAREGGYAVGAFNTINLETTRAIVEAAQELKSPVIIQVTEKTMEYAGGRMIFNIIKNDVEFYAPEIPVAIHLDHGGSFEIVQRAVEIGWPSVMYDGSRKEYVDNVEMTKKVVGFCHEKGVAVQGELGNVPYLSEHKMGAVDWDKYMTDPEQAKDFVERTGVDTLAVAIGNAHGFFVEREIPDFERLEKIRSLIDIPIILHGASDWEDGKAEQAIKMGVNCFNVDTDTRMAFVNSLSTTFKSDKDPGFDVRTILGDARKAVKESVKHKMRLFGSDGKA